MRLKSRGALSGHHGSILLDINRRLRESLGAEACSLGLRSVEPAGRERPAEAMLAWAHTRGVPLRLIERGLVVSDPNVLMPQLEPVGYYRLCA